MKKLYLFIPLFIGAFIIFGCSDSPSSSQKDDQFKLINESVKKILGEEYEAQNFSVTEEGYTDEGETGYMYKFTFDLNKPYLIIDGKKLPGELQFRKNSEGGWECTLNSGNALGLFNLLKI